MTRCSLDQPTFDAPISTTSAANSRAGNQDCGRRNRGRRHLRWGQDLSTAPADAERGVPRWIPQSSVSGGGATGAWAAIRSARGCAGFPAELGQAPRCRARQRRSPETLSAHLRTVPTGLSPGIARYLCRGPGWPAERKCAAGPETNGRNSAHEIAGSWKPAASWANGYSATPTRQPSLSFELRSPLSDTRIIEALRESASQRSMSRRLQTAPWQIRIGGRRSRPLRSAQEGFVLPFDRWIRRTWGTS